MVGFWEEGGKVEAVMDARGRTVLEEGRTILTGVVQDSLGRTPIEGAYVRLSGAEKPVVADREGRFWFRDISDGTHHLSVTWPALEIAGHWSDPIEVAVRAGESASANPRMPSDARFLAVACRPPEIPDNAGVLVLHVGGSETISREAVDSVSIRWRDVNDAGDSGTMEITGIPDVQGRFVVCGVPKGRTLRILLIIDGEWVSDTTFAFPRDRTFVAHTAHLGTGSPRIGRGEWVHRWE